MITDHGQFLAQHPVLTPGTFADLYMLLNTKQYDATHLTDDLYIDAHSVGNKPKETIKIIHYRFENGRFVREVMELSMYHFDILRTYFDNRTRQITELAKDVKNGTNEKRVWYAGKWHKKQVKEEYSNLPEGVTDEDIG